MLFCDKVNITHWESLNQQLSRRSRARSAKPCVGYLDGRPPCVSFASIRMDFQFQHFFRVYTKPTWVLRRYVWHFLKSVNCCRAPFFQQITLANVATTKILKTQKPIFLSFLKRSTSPHKFSETMKKNEATDREMTWRIRGLQLSYHCCKNHHQIIQISEPHHENQISFPQMLFRLHQANNFNCHLGERLQLLFQIIRQSFRILRAFSDLSQDLWGMACWDSSLPLSFRETISASCDTVWAKGFDANKK